VAKLPDINLSLIQDVLKKRVI